MKLLGATKHRVYAPILTFTRSAADGDAPEITAATADDADFIWRGPNGTFIGKTPDIANFPAGDFTLRSTAWDAVTQINFASAKITSLGIERVLPRLTSITTIDARTNAGLTTDISGWTLPSTLQYLYLFSTSVEGDISGWTLPAALAGLSMYGTSVEGDISGWTLPAALVSLSLHSTSVEGDISGWTLPATLQFLYLFSTSVDYGTGDMFDSATRDSSTYRLDDCAMIAAEVDRILADCVDSGTTGSTLNINGTNAAPSAAGDADVTTLEGDGWTVTTS